MLWLPKINSNLFIPLNLHIEMKVEKLLNAGNLYKRLDNIVRPSLDSKKKKNSRVLGFSERKFGLC